MCARRQRCGRGMEEKASIYRLADVRVKINYIHESFAKFAAGYEAVDSDGFDEEICVTQEDIEREAELSARTNVAEGREIITYSDDYLETLAVYRKLCDKLVMRDILLFHSSAVEIDGRAYLFTAPSGTGKSTHARLWREVFGDRVRMINDDKPLLYVTTAGVIVYGTPWDGKHHLSTNTFAPVAGICFLARGAENRIRRITGAEAMSGLLGQAYVPEGAAERRKETELVFTLAKTVPMWKLECNMEPEAAMVSYQAMSEVRQE